MTLLTGYDSTNALALPEGADFYLGYVDGFRTFNNYAEVRARFPTARILTVTTVGSRADIADIEMGDLTVAAGAALYLSGQVRALYSDISDGPAIASAVGGPFNWWPAAPGPARLFNNPGHANIVGTQYGFQGSYDTSIALASFVNPQPPDPRDPEDTPKMDGFYDPEGVRHLFVANPDGHLVEWIFTSPVQVIDRTAQEVGLHPTDPPSLYSVAP